MSGLKTFQSFSRISADPNLVRGIVTSYNIDIANAHHGIIYEQLITNFNKG